VNVRKKRQQTGTIFRARGFWYVRYFEDRVEHGEVKHARIAAAQTVHIESRGKLFDDGHSAFAPFRLGVVYVTLPDGARDTERAVLVVLPE
jgi:ABC-type histidine transport system ATPase subunit